MDGDICDFPPMHVDTTIEYARILNQGMYLTQMDGHMSYELIRKTLGHYYRFVRNIYLMSSTEALVNYVHPKKEGVKENFFNLFTQDIPTIVNGVEIPLLGNMHANHPSSSCNSP